MILASLTTQQPHKLSFPKKTAVNHKRKFLHFCLMSRGQYSLHTGEITIILLNVRFGFLQ